MHETNIVEMSDEGPVTNTVTVFPASTIVGCFGEPPSHDWTFTIAGNRVGLIQYGNDPQSDLFLGAHTSIIPLGAVGTAGILGAVSLAVILGALIFRARFRRTNAA